MAVNGGDMVSGHCQWLLMVVTWLLMVVTWLLAVVAAQQ